MTKEKREALAQLNTLKAEVRGLMGENKLDDAENKMGEVRELQRKIKLMDTLDGADGDESRDMVPAGGQLEKREQAQLETEYRQVFVKALRRQRVSADERSLITEYEKRAMHEGGVVADPDGDSSLVVPQDISTDINKLMRTLNDLTQHVRPEQVRTLSGSRVLEADANMVPLAVMEEYAEAGELDNPKFVPITYKLVKRGGILPITNELLADTDQNLLAYIVNWIGRKVVVTKNSLVIALLNTLSKVDLADVDAIKRVLNVTLDPTISQTSILLTNQDGFHWLDTQKDDQGRDLLQNDITQPGRKLFRGRPIYPVSNRYLPSAEISEVTKAPIIIGNLQQMIVWFHRGRFELASTKEGGSAFARDTTDLRVITRDDMRKWDTAAVVYGQLTIE